MSKLHSLLAVYGAIDEAVTGANSTEVSRRAEQHLPGTTRYGQAGWFDELKAFTRAIAAERGVSAVEFPDLTTALDDLANCDAGNVGVPTSTDVLSPFDLHRLDGALAALRDIKSMAAESVPTDTERLVTPPVAAETGVADAIPPLTDKLRRVNGEYCSVLTGEFTIGRADLNEIAAALEPLNWAEMCRFFRSMTPQDPDSDSNGWNRVLEEVGTDFALHTALRYWKGEVRDSAGNHRCLYVNYDLDEARVGDDGWVAIDNGFVAFYAINGEVVIRTSKELLIRGLSPTATTVLAQSMGWAEVGREMFENARDLPSEHRPWSTSPGRKQTIGKAAPAKPITLPKGIRSQFIDNTTPLLDSYIHTIADKTADFADNWVDGLTPEDLKKWSTEVSAEMIDYSEKIFDIPKRMFLPPPGVPR